MASLAVVFPWQPRQYRGGRQGLKEALTDRRAYPNLMGVQPCVFLSLPRAEMAFSVLTYFYLTFSIER